MTTCMFCHNGIEDDKAVMLRIEYSASNTGTFNDYILCQSCKNIVKGEIDKTIHGVKHKMRTNIQFEE